MDNAVREIDMEAYNTQIRPFAFALSGQVSWFFRTHTGCVRWGLRLYSLSVLQYPSHRFLESTSAATPLLWPDPPLPQQYAFCDHKPAEGVRAFRVCLCAFRFARQRRVATGINASRSRSWCSSTPGRLTSPLRGSI